MTLTIDLPDEMEASLVAQAIAQGVSTAGFARRVLEQALLIGGDFKAALPRKSAYGLLAQYGPGPSEGEIDENRREMFRGFAGDPD